MLKIDYITIYYYINDIMIRLFGINTVLILTLLLCKNLYQLYNNYIHIFSLNKKFIYIF